MVMMPTSVDSESNLMGITLASEYSFRNMKQLSNVSCLLEYLSMVMSRDCQNKHVAMKHIDLVATSVL